MFVFATYFEPEEKKNEEAYRKAKKQVRRIIQGGPKKQPPSDIAITQPKINICISYFQGLKGRYFDTRSPNFIKK